MPEPPSSSLRACIQGGLIAFALFFAIALCIGHDPLQPIDEYISSFLRDIRKESPQAKVFFDGVKELVGLQGCMVQLILVGIALLHFGRYWLTVGWVLAVEMIATMNDRIVKHLFARPRPFGNTRFAGDWSFPSGHSVRAIVLYGLVAYFVTQFVTRRWARILAVTALAVVVLLIGFSRVFLGKHYFSDVIGSFAFGAVWLAIWIGIIETNAWCGQRRAAWHERMLAKVGLGRRQTPEAGAPPSANAPGVS